jgi:hypothetical protein
VISISNHDSNFRLFYSQGSARIDGYDAIKYKWATLKIKIAHGIIQNIIVPGFGIDETQSLTTHFADDENGAIIFVTADLEQGFAKSLITQHLADYFKARNLKGDISLILNTPEHHLSELLRVILRIPELPKSWMPRFDNEPFPDYFTEVSKTDAMDLSDSDISQTEANDIMNAINAALQEDRFRPNIIFETEPMEREMGTDTSSKTLSLNMTGTRCDVQTHDIRPQEGCDAEIRGDNMKSGFAGEFYVDLILRKMLTAGFQAASTISS